MIRTIPFSIEAWKAGGVPITRDGAEVKQLTLFEGVSVRTDYPLRGVIEETITQFSPKGKRDIDCDSSTDLMLQVEVKEPREWGVWVCTPTGHITSNTRFNPEWEYVRVREVLE